VLITHLFTVIPKRFYWESSDIFWILNRQYQIEAFEDGGLNLGHNSSILKCISGKRFV